MNYSKILIICKVCKQEKNINDFYKGHRQCKICFSMKQKKYKKKYQKEIKERDKKRRLNFSSERILCEKQYKSEYRKKNRERIRIARQKWAENNREKDNNYKRKWRKNNKQKEYKYQFEKRKVDIIYKLKGNLRHRIWMALKGGVKSDSTRKLLGCSYEGLKDYLESQFKDGMTWKNHGNHGWHIDHIIPCEAFDLRYEEEQQKCFHYSNLKPEWAHTNISKGDTLLDGKLARNIPLALKSNRSLNKMIYELERFE